MYKYMVGFVLFVSGSLSAMDSVKLDIPQVEFYFARHGVTDWNKDMLVLGPQDLHLNEAGRSQARVGRESLAADITMIVSSKLKRCTDTVAIYCEQKHSADLPKIVQHELFEERFFGDWSKCQERMAAFVEKAEYGPNFFKSVEQEIESNLPDDAETPDVFNQRIIRAFNDILNKNKDEKILFMGHGCIKIVLDTRLPILRNDTDNKDYARLIKYTPTSDGWIVSYVDANS